MEKNAEGNKMARLILSTRSLNSDKKQSLEAQQAKKQKNKNKGSTSWMQGPGKNENKSETHRQQQQGNAQRRPRWKEIRKEAIKKKNKEIKNKPDNECGSADL